MDIYEEKRPWGSFRRFTENELTTVKILTVLHSEEFSLQEHEHRAEFWRILSGNPKVTIGEKTERAYPGDEFYIPPKTHHRISADEDDVHVLEISFGQFDEADITRFEDKYERT